MARSTQQGFIRLSEQRNQPVADVAAGTASLEIVGSNSGKAQGIITVSEGQQSGWQHRETPIGLGVELKPEGGLFAVTHQVPPGRLRYLKKHAKLMSVL